MIPNRDLRKYGRLVSAMGWREQFEGLVFATHDLALSAAARSSGFEVIGTRQP